jgi:hypothetical protein
MSALIVWTWGVNIPAGIPVVGKEEKRKKPYRISFFKRRGKRER